MNKKISNDHTIANIDWIHHGSQIMLSWNACDISDYNELIKTNKWINEHQIQVSH